MVIEILIFNSIKRPFVGAIHTRCHGYKLTMMQAIGSHLLGLVFLAGAYLGWAAIGQLLTGWYPFFWLDAAEVGSEEAVTVYCIGFVLLAPLSKSILSKLRMSLH